MLYALLLFPGATMVYRLTADVTTPDVLVHGSGEWSARLMIVALAVTPLRRLLPDAVWVAWLARQRRTLGVCAFVYAALHTVFYVVDMGSLDFILAELGALGIWTGWLALALFLPLAATSNDLSVHALGGRRWRMLHRLVYVAAVAVLVHWMVVHNDAVAAWLHFLPLLLLEVLRVSKTFLR